MASNGNSDHRQLIYQHLREGAKGLGVSFARAVRAEGVAGALLLLELVVPILLDCESHGLTVTDVRSLLVVVARGIRDAEKTT